MKFLFFSLLASFFQPATEPPATVNIYWTTRVGSAAGDCIYYNHAVPLVWLDFKGPAGPESSVAAVTTSGFGYNADMSSSNGKAQINIGVYCFFNKNQSWVRSGKTTPYILNHEQHHFDASFIAANLFIDRIKNTPLTYADCNTLLPKIYKQCCDIMNKMQDDYDGQTHNGQLEEMQQKWNGFFNERLLLITK